MINLPSLKIIVVVGPTASGKSDLGIKIAKKINGEIISADSRQVYTGMNLGTGKVPKDSFRNFQFPIPARPAGGSNFQINSKFKISNKEYYSSGIRHHLIDVVNPKKQFTASDFKRLGEKAIKDITVRGKIPVIVGGTGFYIDILLGRMAIAEVPINKKLRAELEKQSAEHLFKKLFRLDPDYSKIVDKYNKRRLIRALEIVMTTKKPIPTYNPEPIKYKVLWLGINPGKEKLAQNIKNRLDRRLKPSFTASAAEVTSATKAGKATTGEQDMIKEVEKLHKRGISWKRLDDFGLEYRWISRYIKNKKSNIKNFKNSEEYINLLRDIIRYSKRQMTWFKRNKEIHWFTLNKVEGLEDWKVAEDLVKKFLR